MKVILVAGHHRWSIFRPWRRPDSGAVPRYDKNLLKPPVYTEHEEAEKLVRGVYYLLKAEGYEVEIVPYYYNLKEKTRYINKYFSSRDYVFSIHMNGSVKHTVTGCEIWYYSGSNISSRKAKAGAKILSETLHIPSRGKNGVFGDKQNRWGRLGIIRDTKPWAFLFECGYITNPKDTKKARMYGHQALYDSIKTIINTK